MKREYSIELRTPQGFCKISANSLPELSRLLSISHEKVSALISSTPKHDLDTRASEALYLYRTHLEDGNRPASRIAEMGFELELIKCYLKRMTIRETVDWLQEHCGLKTSLSSVGRYWPRLFSLGLIRTIKERSQSLF